MSQATSCNWKEHQHPFWHTKHLTSGLRPMSPYPYLRGTPASKTILKPFIPPFFSHVLSRDQGLGAVLGAEATQGTDSGGPGIGLRTNRQFLLSARHEVLYMQELTTDLLRTTVALTTPTVQTRKLRPRKVRRLAQRPKESAPSTSLRRRAGKDQLTSSSPSVR